MVHKLQLIEDLLSYSRLQSRSEPYQPVELQALIQTVLGGLKLSIQETNAIISVGRMPTLFAEPSQMRQLFQNLISNAIKYNTTNTPEITVDARQEEGSWSQKGLNFDRTGSIDGLLTFKN